ncbi:MAG: galactose-1-phosphate uridylyltransferase [Desulfurococcaceae archaeon]
MMHEIRWNPLIKQWIIVAAHRVKRPWRPNEKDKQVKCPFCPGAPELKDLEKWDVVVLPNRYPALTPQPGPFMETGFHLYKAIEARGVAEVVVETPQHEGDLCDLSIEHMKKVIDVFKTRVEKLSRIPHIEYVAVFRNKGKEIGVSLTHPHSQIYALPFIPHRITSEIDSLQEYRERYGSCMLCDIVRHELEKGRRVIYRNKHFVAILPYYAMWPYEIHLYPIRHVKSLLELSGYELTCLADIIRVVTKIYNVWLARDAPYIMAFHDHPVKGQYEYHFHVEFYQPYRDREKLKYAAGIEWGYWVFTYDGVPEERADEIKSICRESVSYLGDVLGECG